jgi:3-hydroxyanthranilate 3,4-dioxygenase
MDGSLAAVNLDRWLAENRERLVPPVGTKVIYGAGQNLVTVVGGPNARKDYHVELGEV